MANKDLYEVLGVGKDASDKEIKSSFRKLAKKYHPDSSSEENSEEKFKGIQEAYSILSDPQKKQAYDQHGYDAFQNNQGAGGGGYEYSSASGDFSDIFSDIFSSFGGGGRSRSSNRAQHGADMQMGVHLSFKEAVFGIEKEFKVTVEENCHTCGGSGAEGESGYEKCILCGGSGVERVQQKSLFGMVMTERSCSKCGGLGKIILKKCSSCSGSGRGKYEKDLKIKFPPGVDDGAQMKVAGSGQGGFMGGRDGDLYIYVEVGEDEFFSRDGNDITIDMPVDFSTLVLGGTIEVPTINGKVDLKIPAGTNSHSIMRMKGKGVASANKAGDQMVKLIAKTPKKLSGKEKDLYKKLHEIDHENDNHKGIFHNLKKWF